MKFSKFSYAAYGLFGSWGGDYRINDTYRYNIIFTLKLILQYNHYHDFSAVKINHLCVWWGSFGRKLLVLCTTISSIYHPKSQYYWHKVCLYVWYVLKVLLNAIYWEYMQRILNQCNKINFYYQLHAASNVIHSNSIIFIQGLT